MCLSNTSYLPAVSDNCGISSFAQTSGRFVNGTLPVGTSPVGFSVRDNSGNSNQCSFNIVVRDVEDPVISKCFASVFMRLVLVWGGRGGSWGFFVFDFVGGAG